MTSQQKQNPVLENPNIDSGIGSFKIQKKTKLGYNQLLDGLRLRSNMDYLD
jgi:hypothetical protein